MSSTHSPSLQRAFLQTPHGVVRRAMDRSYALQPGSKPGSMLILASAVDVLDLALSIQCA